MTYQSVEFFPKRPPGFAFHKPDGPVECRVVRADLVGLAAFGARGIFHTGLLFSTPQAKWAIELTIQNFAELIPTIVNGSVQANSLVKLGYYPPADVAKWLSYWTVTSDVICTITPEQYSATMKQVTDVIGPQFPYYSIFGITSKPNLRLAGQTGIKTTQLQTQPNTCDRLVEHVFQYLHGSHGVECRPFPITRAYVQIVGQARKVDRQDPGLLAYARELDNLVGALAKLGNKNYIAAAEMLFDASQNAVQPFRYFFSLELDAPYTAGFYVVPSEDTSVTITDVLVDLGRARHYAEATGAAFSAIDDWSAIEVGGVAITDPYSELLLPDGRTNPAVGRDSLPAQRQWIR